MMDLDAALELALNWVLEAEGGWANDPDDRGGPTKFGITLGVFKGLGRDWDLDHDGDVDVDDLVKLNAEQAKRIYRKLYWPWGMYGAVMPELVQALDRRILIKHFDTGVNCGRKAADLLLQRAANLVLGPLLREDARIGVRTLSAVNRCHVDDFLKAFVTVQLLRYERIIQNDATQEKWRSNWTKRARRLPKLPPSKKAPK